MRLDRRQMLAASTMSAAVALLARPFGAFAATLPTRPVARVEPVTETRWGVKLVDNYRWMENAKDAEWEPFMKGQAAYARAWFDALPDRAAIGKRVAELSGDTALVSGVQQAGGKMFIEKRPVGASNFKLFVVEGGVEKLLIDPETVKDASGAHSSLDYWQPSPDGRYVAYGMSAAGSENSTIAILDLTSGATLPEQLDRAQYGSPMWAPDSSGFFFMRGRDGAVLNTPDYYADRVSWFHRVGTDPAKDTLVMSRPTSKTLKIDPYEFPIVITQPGTDTAILGLFAGVRREYRLLTAPLADAMAGKADWKPVCEPEDRITSATLKGDDLYLLSEKDAPLGRLLKTSAAKPALASATEVVPQGKVAMEQVYAAQDAVYLQVMDGGNQRFVRIDAAGKASDVAMPFNAGIYSVFAAPDQPGFYARMSGWLDPVGIYRYDPATGKLADTGLSPRPKVDLTPFEAVSTFATARDGTKVPVTIIAKKGLKRDGSAPLLADAYGSYQISATPALQLRQLAFMERGGVIASVGVRGGGEYGRPWWEAGKKKNKPNTWRDMIDTCEFLIREGWTSSPRLAITGGSAGGIMAGRSLTERPDLFGLVISQVGWSNTVRGEAEQNNAPNIPEFGTAGNEEEFPAILEMDSVQHVKDGTAYPMVIMTTGMTDPRVAPWHAAKMAARLQAATTSKKPILLRVDFDAGHGLGSTREQRDVEQADLYAAVLSLRA